MRAYYSVWQAQLNGCVFNICRYIAKHCIHTVNMCEHRRYSRTIYSSFTIDSKCLELGNLCVMQAQVQYTLRISPVYVQSVQVLWWVISFVYICQIIQSSSDLYTKLRTHIVLHFEFAIQIHIYIYIIHTGWSKCFGAVKYLL